MSNELIVIIQFFCFVFFSQFSRNCADTSFRHPGVFPIDYNKFEPPNKKGNPAHVYIDLRVMDIDRIDEGRMEFSMQSYIVEYWKDTRLNLSTPSTESNPLFPDVERLWTPDLVFDNAKSGVLFSLSVPNSHVRVSEGSFIRSTRYNLVIGCQMNFRYYPMDTQECFLKLALLSNPEHKVTLHWVDEVTNPKRVSESIRFTNDIQPLKYRILPPKSYKTKEQWTAGNYTYLYANFTFARRLSGSLVNVYVPSVLVVSLSWISFWLDVAAAPARVTLGVTSLLTLATQVVQARTGLPPISYMTAMDCWLSACLVAVFGSLIEYAFAYQLYSKNKKLTFSGLHKQLNADNPERRQLRSGKSSGNAVMQSNLLNFNRKSTVQIEDKNSFSELLLDRYCRKFFPFTFLAFAIVYWTYFLWLI